MRFDWDMADFAGRAAIAMHQHAVFDDARSQSGAEVQERNGTGHAVRTAQYGGRADGGGCMAGPEAQPDDGWRDVFIVRKVSRRVIAKLLMLYKNGQHFQNGQLTEAAKPYFIYRRAKSVSLRAADGRGPIIATGDGECAPCKQVSVQVQPLAGRVLLPLPAYQRFTTKKAGVK